MTSNLSANPASGEEGVAILQQGHPSLTNPDLAPTPLTERRWTWWHYATLWMGMVHNIFNFTWMGGLIVIGFSVWQAFIIAAAGTLIQTFVIGYNGRVGSRYGIPFPVWARASFGVRGANIPALLRGAVAVGWFGVQSYLAALAVNLLFRTAMPAWRSLDHYSFLGASANLWIAMVVYWLLNFLVLRHGMETIRRFEVWAGPAIFVVVAIMLGWILTSAHGVGPLFSQPSHIGMADFFETKFIPGVALFIAGSWATMALNIPDLTRFARSNKEQFWGTMIGLPAASIVYYAMAALIVSAGIDLFHKTLWNPADVLTAINIPALSVIGALILALATISVNIPANIVSPSYDLNNLAPRLFTFKRAAVVAIIISFVYGPWEIMKNPDTLYSVLDNIGAVLGPILGIVMADFFIVRRRRLAVRDLYQPDGIYRASGGYNLVAIGVFLAVTAVLIIGEYVPPVGWLYNNAWFVGVILGFVVYTAIVILLRAAKARSAAQFQAVGSEGIEAVEREQVGAGSA
jgi:NCS1 family nucleobase:cation symporter-1